MLWLGGHEEGSSLRVHPLTVKGHHRHTDWGKDDICALEEGSWTRLDTGKGTTAGTKGSRQGGPRSRGTERRGGRKQEEPGAKAAVSSSAVFFPSTFSLSVLFDELSLLGL